MSKKITWDVVYKDFRLRHPNLSKAVTYWCPHDYVTIKLYFEDGRIGTYNYISRKFNFMSERWTNDTN